MGTPILSLATAKSFLEIRDSVTTHDATLNILLSAVTDQIANTLGIGIERKEYTEYFDTRRTVRDYVDLRGSSEEGYISRATDQFYVLSGFQPVEASGLQVWYDPSRDFLANTLLVEDEDYVIDWEDSYLTLKIGTMARTRALKVTYTAGIEAVGGDLETNAPADLQLGALFQLGFLFKRRRQDNIGFTGDAAMNAGDNSRNATQRWNVTSGLCAEAQGHLRAYKKPLMGRG